MTKLVDGKKIADEILDSVRLHVSEIASYGITPILTVILVGDNPASLAYTRIKQARAELVGLKVVVENFPLDTSEEDLIKRINALNTDKKICGVLVQLPLPPHVDRQKVLDAVQPELDVDCLTSFNKSRLDGSDEPFFWPPAAKAVIKILEDYSVLDGTPKNILIVGAGDLIGGPLGAIFKRRGIAFKTADRKTRDLKELALASDVIITGVGKEKLITGDMVKDGAVVIDAGTTGSSEGGIVGDVDFDSVSNKVSLLSPVPGGVGPVTVAMLLENFVKAAVRRYKISH